MQKTFANSCLLVSPFKLYDSLLSKIICIELCGVNSTRFDPPQGTFLKSPTHLCPTHCKSFPNNKLCNNCKGWLWTL